MGRCDQEDRGYYLSILEQEVTFFFLFLQEMLLAKIKNCEYSFPEEHWQGISDQAKDLIGQLLQINSKLRPSAQQVLQHPWLQQTVPETPLQTPVVLNRSVLHFIA